MNKEQLLIIILCLTITSMSFIEIWKFPDDYIIEFEGRYFDSSNGNPCYQYHEEVGYRYSALISDYVCDSKFGKDIFYYEGHINIENKCGYICDPYKSKEVKSFSANVGNYVNIKTTKIQEPIQLK